MMYECTNTNRAARGGNVGWHHLHTHPGELDTGIFSRGRERRRASVNVKQIFARLDQVRTLHVGGEGEIFDRRMP